MVRLGEIRCVFSEIKLCFSCGYRDRSYKKLNEDINTVINDSLMDTRNNCLVQPVCMNEGTPDA